MPELNGEESMVPEEVGTAFRWPGPCAVGRSHACARVLWLPHSFPSLLSGPHIQALGCSLHSCDASTSLGGIHMWGGLEATMLGSRVSLGICGPSPRPMLLAGTNPAGLRGQREGQRLRLHWLPSQWCYSKLGSEQWLCWHHACPPLSLGTMSP